MTREKKQAAEMMLKMANAGGKVVEVFVPRREEDVRADSIAVGKSRGERYARVYAILKLAGHSPAKAIEIIIDAKRPSTRQSAMAFVRHARSCFRNTTASLRAAARIIGSN